MEGINARIKVIHQDSLPIGAVLEFICPSLTCDTVSVRLGLDEFEWFAMQAPYEVECPNCKILVKFNQNKFTQRDN
jgi:hypothetical protein